MTNPPPRDSFVRQWLTAIVGLALAVGGWWYFNRPRNQTSTVPMGSARWYLVLRMPPISANYESGVDTMRVRYEQWLMALRRAGFVPIKLSDVQYRLTRNEGLPERAVLFVFEPGFRRTLTVLGPILERHGWRALWLTNSKAMKAGHREYITFHQAKEMAGSDGWDVGFSRSSGGYDIRSRLAAFRLGSSGQPPWSQVEGTFALNQGWADHGLNILNVKADWTPDELVARLSAELPVLRQTCLGVRRVQSEDWGVTESPATRTVECPRFNLEAKQWRRRARIYWLGTADMPGFRISVRARRITGELQLHLWRDESKGTELTVIYREGRVRVDRNQADGHQQLAQFTCDPRPDTAIEATVADDVITVAAGGCAPWTSEKLTVPHHGLFALSAFEMIRGVARAEDLQVLISPMQRSTVATAGP